MLLHCAQLDRIKALNSFFTSSMLADNAFIQILPALHTLFLELGFLIRFIEKIVNSDFVPQEVLGIYLIKETHYSSLKAISETFIKSR